MFYVGFDIGKCHHEVGVIDDKGQILDRLHLIRQIY